ncbi:MAG: CCA tRNA nucleotidyltransferase [Clostridia bacterium]|nr:CCA tRNA nucleotidyltransferase [Clostridia bacterium]
MSIRLPGEVEYIIDTLETNGYDAYAVGGCVRDGLLGKEPKDWDICTPAPPAKTLNIFGAHHIIETGLKHGTVTLMIRHQPFEITTYRVDGPYSDCRRPDRITFVSCLREDLSRRDFTINAMAYHPSRGTVDFFGGMRDLKAGVIRCVGDAGVRFGEDALRIMRALRLAAELGFTIDSATSAAMLDRKNLLGTISAERIAGELNRLIVGDGAGGLLLKHMPVLTAIIPELEPAIGFEQHNPHHCYDVMTHILVSVDNAAKDVSIRLAMLLHDIAKPECYTEEDGIGRFHGHPRVGSERVKEILTRLKYDRDTTETVTQLVLYHDAEILPDRRNIKGWLNRIGEARVRKLIHVKRADAMAQEIRCRHGKLRTLDEIGKILDDVILRGQCFALKDLEVCGRDLLAMGVPEGAEIGAVLRRLLELVIGEQIENERVALLAEARTMLRMNRHNVAEL